MAKFWQHVKTDLKVLANIGIAINKVNGLRGQDNAVLAADQDFITMDEKDLQVFVDDARAIKRTIKKLKGPTAEEQNQLDIEKHSAFAKDDTDKAIAVDTARTDNDIREHSAKTDDAIRILQEKELIRQQAARADWALEKEKKEYYRDNPDLRPRASGENISVNDDSKEDADVKWFGRSFKEVEELYANRDETTLGDAVNDSEESVCLVPYTLFERSTTLIAGETGAGKSTLLYQMLLDLVNNRASTLFPDEEYIVPDYSITPLLLDSEDLNKNGVLKKRYPTSATKGLARIKYLGGPKYSTVDDFKLYCWKRFQSLTAGDRFIVCLDNATAFGKTLSQSLVSSLADFFSSSIRFALEHGIYLSYVIVLHINKGDKGDYKAVDLNDISGSSYFGILADNIVILGNTTLGENDKYLKIEKSRIDAKPKGVFHLFRTQKDQETDYLHFENKGLKSIDELLAKSSASTTLASSGDAEMTTAEKIRYWAYQKQEDNPDKYLTQKQIAEKTGFSERTVSEHYPEELKRKHRSKSK